MTPVRRIAAVVITAGISLGAIGLAAPANALDTTWGTDRAATLDTTWGTDRSANTVTTRRVAGDTTWGT